MLTDKENLNLRETANKIRQSIIEMLVEAGSGHTAGPLGMTDVFTFLYFHALRHDPKKPDWFERDRVVLSNGHICPVYYATMAHAGYFPLNELKTLRKFGTRLQGHPHREFMPWLETSSGPLGSGLSQATGMAIADQIDHKDHLRTIYCLMSDGEINEGNTWEAMMLAAKHKLHNLIAIVDRNKIQIDGNTEDIMPLDSLADKWRAFNWHVIEASGHDFDALQGAIKEAKSMTGKPTVIIAYTIPGKGVDFMERDYLWHGAPPGKVKNDPDAPEPAKQAKEALRQLRTLQGQIKSEHE